MLAALDGILQPLLRLAAVCYAAGLIIESAFLSSHGVSGFDLIKSQYILVGVSWAAQTTGVYVVLKLFRHFGQHLSIFWRALKCLVCLALLSLFLAYCLLIFVYLPQKTGYDLLGFWGMILLYLLTFAAVGYSIEKWFIFGGLAFKRQVPLIWTDQPNYFLLVCAFVCAVPAIPIYSTSIFPMIPQSWGGGRLQMVSILIKPEEAAAIQNFGDLKSDLGVSCKPMITGVFLLADQSDGYVVTSAEHGAQLNVGKKSFRIPKEAVELIVQYPMILF